MQSSKLVSAAASGNVAEVRACLHNGSGGSPVNKSDFYSVGPSESRLCLELVFVNIVYFAA